MAQQIVGNQVPAGQTASLIDIGCTFARRVNPPQTLWNVLMDKRSLISERPPGRWDVEDFDDSAVWHAGRSVCGRANLLNKGARCERTN
ncbi:beta-ketoacyl synthase N-terminal-like domain-containing protein [Mycobacteroides abscessus]|uniref:beta-ketoacyl synthase N-terminal-like domain-containing protein n=1 Tax=Mycobacteroides abscessus TaxID=36809 RepID=UPI000D6A75FC